MSLLLDALKKAAQQKAQKSQQEAPSQASSDETLIRASLDDISGFDADEAGSAPGDETELDHSEIRNRLESDLSQRIAGDETGFDIPDTTDTGAGSTPQEPVASDDTGLDIADVTEYRPGSARSDGDAGDDTGLDIADVTEYRPGSARSDRETGDETGLDIPDATESRAESAPSELGAGDETGLDIAEAVEVAADSAAPGLDGGEETGLDIAEDMEVVDDSAAPEFDGGEETGLDIGDMAATRSAELSEQMQTGDDESIVLSDEDPTVVADADADADEEAEVKASAPEAGDETDISQPAASADEIESAPLDREPDETSAHEQEPGVEVAPQADADEDQDLSLLLVDQTVTDVRASTADRNIPQAIAADTDNALDGLGLVETTDHDTAAEQTDTESTAITSPTQAIGGADDTRRAAAITQSTLTRAETTSTRTYAPDNYDRTLMRPPSDDASRIFAGMKSDSDVVMTPDYAKKVFRSKTSAQRAQHYKIYAGVAVVILLAISVFGAFEYQDESNEIDTSLRALKRDPMPGIISTAKPKEVDLFAATDPESSARTIEIIETANDNVAPAETAAVTEQLEVEEGGVEAVAEVESVPVTDAEAVPVTEAEVVPVEVQQPRTVETAPVEVATSTQSAAPEAEEIETGENLHIVSSSQVTDTDTWLEEAYGAYQSGDYRLAMKRYNQVLEVDPNNRNALLARAAINIHEGDSMAAIQDYHRLLLANPKDSLAMSSMLTVTSYSPEDTETQLKLMIRDEPDSPYLNFALANAYGAQNRWQEAQGYYFRALQNNPQDPNYAYNLAVSLEHISQPGSAITYYRRALKNFDNGLATFNRDVVDQRLQLLGKL